MRRKYNELMEKYRTPNGLILNDYCKNLEMIALNLECNGRLMPYYKRIIDEEAEKRNSSRPKSRIPSASITLQQEKQQILTDLSTTIKENPEEYQILEPSRLVQKLIELGFLESDAVDTVIINLINGKRFELAQKTINNYKNLSFLIKRWQDAIEKSELADIVLRGITELRTPEEDIRYFKYMQEQIRMRNIEYSEIILGKAPNGKEITLNDVFGENVR